MEFNTKYEFEKDIYADFLEEYSIHEEEIISNQIIKNESKLKAYLKKYEKELFEKIIYQKNKLHKYECLRLIKFIIENFKNINNWFNTFYFNKKTRQQSPNILGDYCHAIFIFLSLNFLGACIPNVVMLLDI